MKLLWQYALEWWYSYRVTALEDRAGELAGELDAVRRQRDLVVSKLRKARMIIALKSSARRLLP